MIKKYFYLQQKNHKKITQIERNARNENPKRKSLLFSALPRSYMISPKSPQNHHYP